MNFVAENSSKSRVICRGLQPLRRIDAERTLPTAKLEADKNQLIQMPVEIIEFTY